MSTLIPLVYNQLIRLNFNVEEIKFKIESSCKISISRIGSKYVYFILFIKIFWIKNNCNCDTAGNSVHYS